MLREHAGAIAGLAAVLMLAVLVTGCGFLDPKTASPVDPAKKVTAAGLAGDAVKLQATLDAEYNDLQRRTADYATHVKSDAAALQAAGDDLQRQQQQRAAVMNVIGGVIQNVA